MIEYNQISSQLPRSRISKQLLNQKNQDSQGNPKNPIDNTDGIKLREKDILPYDLTENKNVTFSLNQAESSDLIS